MATPLTRRQRQVLQLAATGLGNREIAERLGCSPRTVDAHFRMAFARLDVGDRIGAFAKLGWLDVGTTT